MVAGAGASGCFWPLEKKNSSRSPPPPNHEFFDSRTGLAPERQIIQKNMRLPSPDYFDFTCKLERKKASKMVGNKLKLKGTLYMPE